MACYYCRHFDEHEKPYEGGLGSVERVKQITGACTLSPTWQTVTGLHYCSQFSPQQAQLVSSFWRQMHEATDEAREQRKLRLAAENKLKELRRARSEAA